MGRCFIQSVLAALLLVGLCHAVEPTREGVAKFLDAVAKGDHDVAGDFISQLGDDDFDTREKATKRLSSLVFPPVVKLEAAAKSKDPEVARRARRVLEQLAARTDPIAELFKTARDRSIKIAPKNILPVLARCEHPPALEAAQEAFAAAVVKDDLEMVRKLVGDKDARLRVAAIRSLVALLKGDALDELGKLLGGKDAASGSAAARALAEAVAPQECRKLAAKVDAETAALLLRFAERRFRLANKDKRGVAGVMDEHQNLLNDYAAVLAKAKDVKTEKKGPQNTQYWLKLGLDTSKHPEVVMYRIRWFAGHWSHWYVPGFNDREVGMGRDIRMWACFNDHEYEVVTTADKAKQREVMDLP